MESKTTLLTLISNHIKTSTIEYNSKVHYYEFTISNLIPLVEIHAGYHTSGRKIIEAYILPTLAIDIVHVYENVDSLWRKIQDKYNEQQKELHKKDFIKRFFLHKMYKLTT